MRTLLLKTVLLLAPFALGLAAVLAHVTWSATARQGVFHPELERRIRGCVTGDTAIVVAGDSAAMWEVVPEIMERRTGLRTANVATAAGDLATLARAVRRHADLFRGRILVVSTGIFQINDGGTVPGYLSTACLLDMTLREKLSVFRHEPRRLLVMLAPVVGESLRRPEATPAGPADGSLPCPGFVGLEGTMTLPVRVSLDPKTIGHHWPWKRRLDGARWRVFREALDRVAAAGGRVYLYHAPVSPAWRAYTAGTFVDRTEREYGAMLAEEVRRHRNVRFLDFYTQPDARLTDATFADAQHLNLTGAVVFTSILADEIAADLAGHLSASGRPAP